MSEQAAHRLISRSGRYFLRFVIVMAICVVSCLAAFGARQADPNSLPEGKGQALVASKCSLCHTLERVVSVRRTKGEWQRAVKNMWERRAPISEDDIPTIADYLFTNFGKPDDPPPQPLQPTMRIPAGYDFSQSVKRGTISGEVTVDGGQAHAFGVGAHNLVYGVRYFVFTKDGHYTVPQALPGPYEVYGADFDYSSPQKEITLEPGGTQTVNLAAKKKLVDTKGITYVDIDTVYPPGPGHDLYVKTCRGCHMANSPHFQMQLSEYGYRMGIEYMRWDKLRLAHTQLSTADMDAIGHYLGSLFDPNERREVKIPDYPIDESIVSKAIFVQYDMPDSIATLRRVGFHDSFRASDGSVWYGNDYNNEPEYIVRSKSFCGCGFMLRVDPKERDPIKRMRFFYAPHGDDFDVKGIAEDSVHHHIYFADSQYGRLGEVDPVSGEVKLHNYPIKGAMHGLYGDERGNIWWGIGAGGGNFGRYDPKTGHFYNYGALTDDFSPYTTVEDHNGKIWTTGLAKGGVVEKFDPVTQIVTEYKTPTPGSGPRRMSVDDRGNIWIAESAIGSFGKVDAITGEITEYKLPIHNISPYMVRLDQKDENVVWGWNFLNRGDVPRLINGVRESINNQMEYDPDSVYEGYGWAPFSYDIKTKKMMYYPARMGFYAAQTSTEPNNTEWFNQRVPTAAPVHFYPDGYTADAPPEP